MEQNKPQTEQELSQQAAVRRQKLADLCEAGHNPFEITKYAQDAYSADLKQELPSCLPRLRPVRSSLWPVA